ncbi:hypothetical protein BH20VER3_BH20VER3_04980 [soil metagenome]
MTPARYQRRHGTKAERILWQHLRNRAVCGHKFRRQHPLEPYILDFYCPEAHLAVELDGSGHAYALRRRQDQLREDFFAQRGIRILRFWNDEVFENLDGVLQVIWWALEEQDRSNPSP